MLGISTVSSLARPAFAPVSVPLDEVNNRATFRQSCNVRVLHLDRRATRYPRARHLRRRGLGRLVVYVRPSHERCGWPCLASIEVDLRRGEVGREGPRAVDRVRREVDKEMNGRTAGNLILMTLICVVIFVMFMAVLPARAISPEQAEMIARHCDLAGSGQGDRQRREHQDHAHRDPLMAPFRSLTGAVSPSRSGQYGRHPKKNRWGPGDGQLPAVYITHRLTLSPETAGLTMQAKAENRILT